MCRENPMEKIPLSWTTITTPGYREHKYTHLEAELFQECIGTLLRCTELQRARTHIYTSQRQCIWICTYIYVCTSVWEDSMYHQLETLFVPPQLYYLRSYYKSHFAGHSSPSIVLAHFNFRPRCKFHLRVVSDKPLAVAMTTSVCYNGRVMCGCGRWVRRLVSFQFIRRT